MSSHRLRPRSVIACLIALSSTTMTLVSCIDDPVELGDHDDFQAQFELLWGQFDTGFVGFVYLDAVDWDTTYEEYSARVDTVSSQAGLLDLLAEMLAQLEDGSIWIGELVPYAPDVTPNYDIDVLWTYLEPQGLTWFADSVWGYCLFDSIPYVIVYDWSSSIYAADIDDVLDSVPNAPALIIDQRMSTGGSDQRIGEVAKRFNDEVRVGYFTVERNGPEHTDLSDPAPRMVYTLPSYFDRPVAVLVGEGSGGAAELFACMADEIPHATLMGDTTMREISVTSLSSLPGGYLYTIPVETVLRADTATWVKLAGVPPDIFIEATEEDFQAGVDPVLEYALDWAAAR